MKKSNHLYPLFLTTGIFILLTLLLYLSFPGNRSENDDGYFYAYAIRNYEYAQLWFPRYLIFLPFFKAILSVAQLLLPSIDAYLLMCVVSAMAATAAVMVFYGILKKYFELSKSVAFCSAAFLFVSYGFWRYAVEAEVYAMALLLCLLALRFSFKMVAKGFRWQEILMTALLVSLCVLWYKPAGIVACIVIPLYLLQHHLSKATLLFWSILVVLLIAAAYAVAYQGSESSLSYWQFVNSGIDRSEGHTLNAVPVVFSNVVSLNFIYAFPSVVGLVHHWFPGKQLVEEIFAAKQQTALAILASIILLLFVSVLLFLVWKIRHYIQLNGFWKNPFTQWLFLYSVALLIVDPGSPEPWLMILPPLIAIGGIYIFPCIETQTTPKKLYALVLLLGVHNFVGGYLFIHSSKQDFTKYQSAWIVSHATSNDMVISLGSASTVRYLLYYSKAKVYSGEQQFSQAMMASRNVLLSGGNIFLTDDFVHPSEIVRTRNAAAFALVQTMLQQQKDNIHLLHQQDENSAAVYQWMPK